MSIAKKFFGGDDSAGDAASAQIAAVNKAVKLQQETRDLVRADLEPFRRVGTQGIDQLGNLVTDPNAQKKYIEDNPFYKLLADDAQDRLFSNAAARGKVGSGGTTKALQNSLLMLGHDLLSRDIGQRFNLATMGANAATGTANVTRDINNSIADLYTQQGNAEAAGIIGNARSKQQGFSNLVNTGLSIGKLALSDARAKENIERVGSLDNGLPVYRFNYRGDDRPMMGVMAQEVEKTQPDAVTTIDGVKYVNYGELRCQ